MLRCLLVYAMVITMASANFFNILERQADDTPVDTKPILKRRLEADSNPSYCTVPKSWKTGIMAKFYRYNLNSKAAANSDFFLSGYKTELLKVVEGVDHVNFASTAPENTVTRGSIYGYDTTISNYTVELTGWYQPQMAGVYTFTLTAKGGASFQFGSGAWCCNDAAGALNNTLLVNTLGTTSGTSRSKTALQLFANRLYPFKIVLFNQNGNSDIDFKISDPNGKYITDFAPNVQMASYLDNPKGACYTTTVFSDWNKPMTSTSTQVNWMTNTVVINIPKPSTTVISTWTGSVTKTQTVTGADGALTAVVAVPPLKADSNPSFCQVPKSWKTGIMARFYRYDLNSKAAANSDFFLSGYKTELLKVVEGIDHVNFASTAPENTVTQGSIYGYDTTISNYTVELTGWYEPQMAGVYTFTLTAKGGASFQFGSGAWCCNDAAGALNNTLLVNTLGTTSGTSRSKTALQLFANRLYPFKIVLFNQNGNSDIDFKISDPNGKYITDFAPNVQMASYLDNPKGACYTTTVFSDWNKPMTSTSTQVNWMTNTVVINIPKPSTTVTSTWTGSVTKTQTVTGADGALTAVVAVPSAKG
ncbi:hypothetical protein JCM33374_g3922 [Metschnikowia sp. JCM 33374]|nr:hypothetical protein JCM33374_g3922 [Metschnikowia sp. JCM 33374]